MANVVGPGGSGTSIPAAPQQTIVTNRAGATRPNPAYTAWLAQYGAAGNYGNAKPASTPQPTPSATRYAVGPDGRTYPLDANGSLIGYNPPAAPSLPSLGSLAGAASGPTWYEQQQIVLDKQRMADAEAAQAAQLAYQAEQQKIAQSNAVESANQSFRDAQLKSTYGTINGMAYASPKGSPFAEQMPEPMLLKEAYAAGGQQDPWSQPAHFGGYTGSGFMNMQQPGLTNQGDHPAPTTGTGAAIPIAPPAAPIPSMARGGVVSPYTYGIPSRSPDSDYTPSTIPGYAQGTGAVPGTTGQPQLIMAHGGEKITPAPGTPMPTLLGSPGGAPFSNPTDPNDQGGGSPDDQGETNPLLTNLIQAIQALIAAKPTFQAPIAPSMAMGGTVPTHAPLYNDIVAGPGSVNHMPYSPALTGLSQYGALMTPNGTPVTMSNWQRANLNPSAITGPGGYEDYAQQVAGWSPTDLANQGKNITGNFGTDLSAPKNYTPISINPAPSGG